MKNFSGENFFEKNITIINSTKDADSIPVRPSINYTADFFPEGGYLVNGLKSVVGFKLSDNKNKGLEGEGVIVDQSNDTIVSFKSLQFGMGQFLLTPETGKIYTALVTLKNGVAIRKNLPEPLNAGYVMHVAERGNNQLQISVQAKELPQNKFAEVYLIVQNNHQVNIAKSQVIENNQATFLIDKRDLKDGVAQLTLFDVNKLPVAERLYFKRPESKMRITAFADKNIYPLRSKVFIEVSTQNKSGIPLNGNLSAAVYKLDDLNKGDEQNIYSYLWLTSDLRGTIENPDYYFNNENEETDSALDNLMLTQGWRKFDRETTSGNIKAFAFVPEFMGHIITGKIVNNLTNEPVAGIPVYLSVPGRHVQLRICISDSNGLLHFEMKDFSGNGQIVLQTNSVADSIYRIEIANPFSSKFSGRIIPEFGASQNIRKDIKLNHVSMQVQNGYHESKLQQILNTQTDTLPFYFYPYKAYRLGDYTRFTTMEEVLREYVMEISVRRNGSKFRLMTFNEPGFKLRDIQSSEGMFTKNPLVILDGVPVFDINKIIAYDPLKVDKLEVVAAKYYLSSISFDGILNYTTSKGKLEGFTFNPNDLILDYDGLQQKRKFYAPQYNTENELNSRLPDFRHLLFWSPEIKTNAEGKGAISFFTNDVPGKYLVVVQGLAGNGDAGSYSFQLSVEK